MLIALLVPLTLALLLFLAALIKAVVASGARPTLETIGLGAVVNFFDALGIGSFAPTTAWLKFRKLVPDRILPCTMLVGLTHPVQICPLGAKDTDIVNMAPLAAYDVNG